MMGSRRKWSLVLGAIGAIIMAAVILMFYGSDDKSAMREWVNRVGFPGVWIGARLFQGAPLTRTTDILFNLYLIAFVGLEGFVLGSCIDFLRTKRRTRKEAEDVSR